MPTRSYTDHGSSCKALLFNGYFPSLLNISWETWLKACSVQWLYITNLRRIFAKRGQVTFNSTRRTNTSRYAGIGRRASSAVQCPSRLCPPSRPIKSADACSRVGRCQYRRPFYRVPDWNRNKSFAVNTLEKICQMVFSITSRDLGEVHFSIILSLDDAVRPNSSISIAVAEMKNITNLRKSHPQVSQSLFIAFF